MFKTTPRSVLMGGNLIRKSATRVYIDEDGNIQHFDDTILDEHIDAYGHTDSHTGEESRVDRAPFGRQEDGNSHMIDAMLEHMLRLAAKNGFDADQMITDNEGRSSTVRDAAIRGINAMIWNHNKDRENDRANHLPHFGDPSWRKLVAGNWFGEKKGRVLNHAAENAGSRKIFNSVTGQEEDTPHMITVTLKKDKVRHKYADSGQYIDAGYNPIHDYVERGLHTIDQVYKQGLGLGPNEIGPFHDPGAIFMQDFTQPGVKPSAMTRGRVHGIRTNDFDDLLQTNRLGKEYADRAEMYGGTPYLPTEANVPVHNVTHGGVHYPIEFHVPEAKTGAGAVGTRKFNRGNEMRQFLQSVVEAGGNDSLIARQILREDATPPTKEERKKHVPLISKLSHSPAMTHFFGGGGSKASKKGQSGYQFKETPSGRKISTLSRIADELNVDRAMINQVHDGIKVDLSGHTVGKASPKVIRSIHALHAALTNQKAAQGSQNPAAEAAEEIRKHGSDQYSAEQLRLADMSSQIADMYARSRGLENPIQGATQAPDYDTSRLYNTVTPASGALVGYQRQEPTDIQTSFDTYIPDISQIQKSFETLQITSAIKNQEVMKHVKKGYSLNSYNDIISFATSVGLTSQDVQGIVSTKGDWDVVAKQWGVPSTIVKATKVTFGGV
jgi:hypothetical protein